MRVSSYIDYLRQCIATVPGNSGVKTVLNRIRAPIPSFKQHHATGKRRWLKQTLPNTYSLQNKYECIGSPHRHYWPQLDKSSLDKKNLNMRIIQVLQCCPVFSHLKSANISASLYTFNCISHSTTFHTIHFLNALLDFYVARNLALFKVWHFWKAVQSISENISTFLFLEFIKMVVLTSLA